MAFSDSSKGELQLTEAQAEAVQKALRYWRHSNLVPASLVGDLLATVRIVEEKHGFDWDKFAKYTSRLSVVCLAIAIASLVFGRAIPNIIKRILALPAAVRVAITSALAATVHVWAYDRSLTTPQQLYLNEAVHSLGALFFGLAALQVTIALQADKRENLHTLHNIELSLALVYGVSAVLVQSNFIWSCGMVVLGIWFGSWSAYASGTYYIGMRYPLRFVLFGASIIIVSSFMRDHTVTFILWSTTRIWGMLYLFVALWMLSLFGNDGVRGDNYGGLGRMAFWSVAFLCAASTAIWHGLRYGDSTTKGFGLTFLGINLYTKFFEFCWSTWYKSVFFTALALSLALMGRYAESMNAALYERYPSLAT